MITRVSKISQIIFICLLLISCDRSDKVSSIGSDAISVEHATIRATPPGQAITAMFMEMRNSSSNDVELIEVKSPISKYAELHLSSTEDGMMQMRQVDKIIIPAKGLMTLNTGGYHVMLIDLNTQLSVGTKVDVELIFNDGSTLLIQPEIKKD